MHSHGGFILRSGADDLAAPEAPARTLSHRYDIPSVSYRRSHAPVLVGVAALAAVLLLLRHADTIAVDGYGRALMALWTVMFAVWLSQLVLAWFEKPFTVTPRQAERLGRMKVTVVIPCYNEDPELVDMTLYALFRQTRLPVRVVVVDDCSDVDYAEVRDHWSRSHPAGIEFHWLRQEVRQGKRNAQGRGFRGDDADVFVTLDSDTALEARALEEGLKPFGDRRVQSVAGIELAYNRRHNLLTQMASIRQLSWEMSVCSAQSVLGNVLINRGTYALYRGDLIRDNLNAYLGETFFGRAMWLGDDTMLTLFALARGRAVQQASSFQLAMYPVTLSHHLRQWTRWMRGSAVRTFWRIKYLRVTSYAWWTTILGLWLFFASLSTTGLWLAMWAVGHRFVMWAMVAPVASAYLTGLRTFAVHRSDETARDRVNAFLLMPVSFVWVFTVLRVLRLWGMATCVESRNWMTRRTVEVTLQGSSA
jgi:hyaluronan synthase